MAWTLPKAAACAAALATPAIAQQQCAGVADMLEGLSQTYGEQPRVSALMSGGELLIITAANAGNWTALGVSADGQACILAAGDAFEVKAPPAAGVDG